MHFELARLAAGPTFDTYIPLDSGGRHNFSFQHTRTPRRTRRCNPSRARTARRAVQVQSIRRPQRRRSCSLSHGERSRSVTLQLAGTDNRHAGNNCVKKHARIRTKGSHPKKFRKALVANGDFGASSHKIIVFCMLFEPLLEHEW